MILRLLRARVKSGDETRIQQYVRDEAVGRALQVPGLQSFQPCVRATSTGLELVIVSTWSGFDEITAAGPRLDSPLLMPGSEVMLEDSRSEHYELVIGQARTMPVREARLRLTRIAIRRGAESAYYAAVRQWSDRLLDETGMVAFTLGRRVVGQTDEIVAVQVWENQASLAEAAGVDFAKPMGGAELARFWAAEPAIEHFDALTATEPSPNAPAIFLADDQRRYVHATPAAAALSGRSIARLLTMRVDDVVRPSDRASVPEAFDRFMAEGSMSGPFVLERPDGSEVQVKFAAKTNTPWPGSHASLMVPAEGDTDGDLDVDAALAHAGFVARYAPAAG